MSAHDPLGYYAVLELQTNATEQEIKSSYRRKAMALHPDRNLGQDTTRQFQTLNEAFEVLSDPVARASYDSPSVRQSAESPPNDVPPLPVKCSSCGKVSAQPRVAVFRSVKSFLFVTLRKPIAGVFCSDCAQKKSLKASATTWLLGWWGFPWGPIYSVQALLDNMFGGTHPPLDNARLLAYQAYYFHTVGRRDIALAVATDALKFCGKIRPTARQTTLITERDDLTNRLRAFLEDGQSGHPPVRLKNTWRIANKLFAAHAGAIGVVVGAIVLGIMNAPTHHYSPPKGPMLYSPQPVSSQTVKDAPAKAQPQQAAQQPVYVRAKKAPNGNSWPVAAGYLKGVAQNNTAGHSEITVNNGQNTSDVHVKLVSLSGKVARPVREIFIPAHSSFTMKTLEPGRYDVRYQDLATGGRSRSEAMTLTETASVQGIEYSTISLTLFKVKNGNMATYDLSKDEF